jgi:hypothetical protein
MEIKLVERVFVTGASDSCGVRKDRWVRKRAHLKDVKRL